MSHQFLSDEWMAAAAAIRVKYADQAAKVTSSIRMNQVITDVPFGDGMVNLFLDTSSGDVVMEKGALDTPDPPDPVNTSGKCFAPPVTKTQSIT